MPRITFVLVVVVAITGQLHAQQDRRPFGQVFALRGVELSEDQQSKVDELRQKYVPKLNEIQQKQRNLYTEEQRRTRGEAIQAARDAGKEGRKLRAAIDEAVQLTDEQNKQETALQKEQTDLLAQIQGELRSLLTPEQQRQLGRQRRGDAQRQPAMPPTHRNVKYGPHERNVMDVWLAESELPTPVLVSIHGGGFRGGNKRVQPDLLRKCLASSISVVAITYRLSDEAIAPAQFHDAARAVQFIRHKAEDWNLDPKRVAATGGSAGAGLSLWLGFHDDLADPDSDDPVLRQSTRLTYISVYNGQTSYDPRFIRDLFPGTDTYKHPALAQLYNVDLDKLDDLPIEKYKLFEEVSAIPHLTKDDSPAQLIYGTDMDTPTTNQGVGIHHPRFGKVLKEKMDTLGIECQVHTRSDRRGADGDLTIEFVKKHFGMK